MNDGQVDALQMAIRACDAAGARYAVIGGVARNAWAPPRATTDVDLAIIVTSAIYPALVRELRASGFREEQVVKDQPGDDLPDVALFRRPTGVVRRMEEST